MKFKGEFIDIGGAKQPHSLPPAKYKWEVLDVSGKAHKYTGYDLNSGKKFPMNDNTVCVFYSSMTIEHVHPSKVQFIFNEMYRTLLQNGKIRIVVPDIEIGMSWYFKNPDKLLNGNGPTMMESYPKTKCGFLFSWINSEINTEKAYGRSGHQMMFDYETLKWYISNAKFRDIKRLKYQVCSEEFIGKDIPRYSEWGLYVEAIK